MEWKWNLTSLCNITKGNVLSKTSTKRCGLETSSRSFYIYKKLRTTFVEK